jgi:hypothetical protein
MERKGIKTTTYSLDWDTVMNLESRLLRDFQTNKTKDRARALLMVSIGVRLGFHQKLVRKGHRKNNTNLDNPFVKIIREFDLCHNNIHSCLYFLCHNNSHI